MFWCILSGIFISVLVRQRQVVIPKINKWSNNFDERLYCVSRIEWPLSLRTPQQRLTMLLNGPDKPGPQNCPFLLGMWILHITWFLGPTRVSPSNGISISSAVFAGLKKVTDRQTHRQTTLYSVGSNSSHLMQCIRCNLIMDHVTLTMPICGWFITCRLCLATKNLWYDKFEVCRCTYFTDWTRNYSLPPPFWVVCHP